MSDSSDKMDVLILVGGKGTRLHSVVGDRPKPMVDVNGQPFLNKLIEYVSSFGHNRFILCAGHMAEYIKKYYQDINLPQEIILSIEKSPLGTAGAVKNAEKLIQTEVFCVMNGDSFCPVDLMDFKAFHYRKKAQISLAVTKAKGMKDYGLVDFDGSQQIVNFEEKKHNSETGYINAGIYLFNKSILREIPKGIFYSLEENLFPSILGKKFFAYITTGEMLDIGSPERYKLAKKYFSS